MITWLGNQMGLLLNFFYENMGHNYWIAILLLTLALRIILLPIVIQQVKSTALMAALQPEIDRIKKRYKGDQQRENQETMELWRRNKVNPFSGCLLLLIQLPVWWALYSVLQNPDLLARIAQSPSNQFLFWSLTSPDKYYVFPILAAASTYLMSQSMGMSQQAQGSAKIMNMMSPVFMLMISVRFPVALSLYFTFSNALQILQQYLTPKPKLVSGEAK